MISNAQTNRRLFMLGAAGAATLLTTGGAVAAAAPAKIKPTNTDLLLVIDVQNCFIPGGALAVKDGDAIVPLINKLGKDFKHVVVTQDWHTAGHASFASTHAGAKPFDMTKMPYGQQVLWPDHCVQGTPGADLAPGLSLPNAELILRKGYRSNVDSYSAFTEADHKQTGLAGYLKQRGIKRVFLVGLATDFCVAWSAVDAARAGFKTYVIEDACRGIDLNGSLAKAWADMKKAGVRRIQSSDIA